MSTATKVVRAHTRTLIKLVATARRRRHLTLKQQLIATLAEAIVQKRKDRK
jgi:hypothetical protein